MAPARRYEVRTMQGLHLTSDLSGCPAGLPVMTQRALCLLAVADSGLRAVGELFYRFPAPGGVTGVVLLAESHVAGHTWPELGVVTLDVYGCNLGAENISPAEALMAALVAAFNPATVQPQRLQRGGE